MLPNSHEFAEEVEESLQHNTTIHDNTYSRDFLATDYNFIQESICMSTVHVHVRMCDSLLVVKTFSYQWHSLSTVYS